MTSEPFALRLQLLTGTDKILAGAAILCARDEDDRFRVRDLNEYFAALAIPVPNNLNVSLNRLKERDLVYSVPNVQGAWTLTPLGQSQVEDLMSTLDPSALESGWRGAEFAHVEQTVIPWYMAPPRWHVGLRRLTETHPFETNVFCMTRFPSEGAPEENGPGDPVHEAIEAIRDTLWSYGLTVHVASDRLIEEDLLGNVGAYMWGCKYGIGILEDRVGRGVNYNAVIELGGMVITGRRCALLKDGATPTLPTDLSGQVYKSVDLDDVSTVVNATEQWANADLGLAKR